MTDTITDPIKPITERRAQAVLEVREMQETILKYEDDISQLRADLNRAEDRIVILTDERTRLRKEAHIYRDNLVELATQQANIGMLADRSKDIMLRVTELLNGVDGHEEAGTEKEAAVAYSLAAVDRAVAGNGDSEMETLSTRPPVSG